MRASLFTSDHHLRRLRLSGVLFQEPYGRESLVIALRDEHHMVGVEMVGFRRCVWVIQMGYCVITVIPLALSSPRPKTLGVYI
jgi:hypothetical protein